MAEPFASETNCTTFRPEIVPLIPATRSSTATPGKPRMIGQKEAQCVSFPPFVRCCSRSYCWPSRRRRSRKLEYLFQLARQRCLCMSSRPFPPRAISGPLATGLTATAITIGCRVRGSWLRNPGSSGPLAIGVGAAAGSLSMRAIGASTLVSTAESIMASATAVRVTKAAVGTTGSSNTTVQ